MLKPQVFNRRRYKVHASGPIDTHTNDEPHLEEAVPHVMRRENFAGLTVTLAVTAKFVSALAVTLGRVRGLVEIRPHLLERDGDVVRHTGEEVAHRDGGSLDGAAPPALFALANTPPFPPSSPPGVVFRRRVFSSNRQGPFELKKPRRSSEKADAAIYD